MTARKSSTKRTRKNSPAATSAPEPVVCDHCPEFAHPLNDDGVPCVNPRPKPDPHAPNAERPYPSELHGWSAQP